MSTRLLLHKDGLDPSGRSQLPLAEVVRQLKNAKAIETLDSAANGIGSGMAWLSIRRDGTFIALPDRASAANSGLEAASVWLHAFEAHALNPRDSTKNDLQEAEGKLDQPVVTCLRRAVARISRSKALKIPIGIDGKIIQIAIPHKATVAAALNGVSPSVDDHEDKHYVTVKKIRDRIEATSTSGIMALIIPDKKRSEIRPGDRILIKLSKKHSVVSRLQYVKMGNQHE